MEIDSVSEGCSSLDECAFETEAYNYNLPPHLIAQEPCTERDSSRLLVLSRNEEYCRHTCFNRLHEHLREGDLIVVNNSKVIPARLVGKKSTGGEVELLLLSPCSLWGSEGSFDSENLLQERDWFCLLRCSGNPRPGTVLHFDDGFEGTVSKKDKEGIWKIEFNTQGNLLDELERVGLPPLPPYIKRSDQGAKSRSSFLDKERYQTVFAKPRGSVAAPTAGLHFTKGLRSMLEKAGISFAEITLHVGLATFRPIRAIDIRLHNLLPERYSISEETCAEIKKAKKEGRRVIAVGTTVVRCLESAVHSYGEIVPHQGLATLYILPGYPFRVINAIITNFHLPKTSLLVLVSAFAGRKIILRAYHEAMRNGYRFYSYGDAMFIH